MIGLGTIANTIAVIIGGGIGLFLKKGIKKLPTCESQESPKSTIFFDFVHIPP